jgi:chemotaxis protein MotB
MKNGYLIIFASLSLLLWWGGCAKDLQEEMTAELRKYPNDTATRVLNEMKRPKAASASVAVVVDERDARIAALEQELATLRAERDRLASRVTEMETELARLRADRDRLAALAAEQEGQSSRIKDLESQVAQLQGQLAQLERLRTEHDRLRAELDECRNKLQQCEGERDALKKRVADLEGRQPTVVEKVVKVPIIELRADALFETARADLTPAGRIVLKKAAEALKKIGPETVKTVRVDGHADNRKISTKEFRDNQALSEVRARAVADFLIKETGVPAEKFVIKGYGDTQPIGDNKTPEGQALNRRVEVSIEQFQ